MNKLLSLAGLFLLLVTSAQAQFLQRNIEINDPVFGYSEIVDMETQRIPGTNIPHALVNVGTPWVFPWPNEPPHFQLFEMNPSNASPTHNYDYLFPTSKYSNTSARAFEYRQGKYYVVGTVNDLTIGNKKMFVTCINETNGNIIWSKIMATEDSQTVYDIDVDSQGNNIYVTGVQYLGGTGDLFVTRLDGGGNVVWHRTFHDSQYETEGLSIDYLGSNEIYIAGASEGSISDRSGRVMKINSSGNVLYNQRVNFYDGGIQQRLRSIHIQKNGQDVFMLAQVFPGSGGSEPGTIYIRKMDVFLNDILVKTYSGVGSEMVSVESYDIKFDRIIIGGPVDISVPFVDGYIQASFNLSGDIMNTVNYKPQGGVVGGFVSSGHSTFLSTDRSLLLGLNNAYATSEGKIYGFYADFSLKTYCDEEETEINESYQNIEAFERQTDIIIYNNVNEDKEPIQLNFELSTQIECYNNQLKGIEEDEKEVGGVNCQPNPFENALNIESHGEEILDITLYNSSGAVVYHCEFKEIHITTLPTESLSPGVYIVNITTKGGEISRQRVIKQ